MSRQGKKHSWWRWLIGVIVLLAVVVTVLFLYINRGVFIQRHVLPRVSAMLGTPVVADRIDFSVFNRLSMSGLRVGDEASPILIAELVRIRWQLRPTLGGNLTLDEVLAENVTVDTSSEELMHLLAQLPPSEPSEEPVRIDLRTLALKNIDITYRHGDAVATVTDLNVALDNLRNGQPFTLAVDGGLLVVQGEDRLSSPNMTLTAKGTMNEELLPVELMANGAMPLGGQVAGISLDDRSITLDANVVHNNSRLAIDETALRMLYRGETESELLLSGSLDTTTSEGSITTRLAMPNANLLNLIGALAGGISFGDTSVNYAGELAVAPQVEALSFTGDLEVRDFVVRTQDASFDGTFAPLTITGGHAISYSKADRSLSIERLQLDIAENERQLARLWLEKPLTMSLSGNGSVPEGERAMLSLRVERLELARFKALLPPELPVNLDAAVATSSYDIQLTAAGGIGITGTQSVEGIGLPQLDVPPLTITQQLTAEGMLNISNYTVTVRDYSLQVTGNEERYLSVALQEPLEGSFPFLGTASFSDATVRITNDGFPLRLPAENAEALAIDAGVLTFDLIARLTRKGNAADLNGSVTLTDLSMQMGGQAFPPLNLVQEIDASFVNLQTGDRLEGTIDLKTRTPNRSGQPVMLAALSLADIYMTHDSENAGATLRLETLDLHVLASLLPPGLLPVDLGNPKVAMLGKLAKSGQNAEISGSFSIKSLHPTLPQTPSAKLPALDIETELDARFALDTQVLQLDRLTAEVTEDGHRIVNLSLQEAATIDPAGAMPIIPIRVTVQGLDLARYQAMLPAELGVRKLGGTVEVKLTASAGSGEQIFLADMAVNLKDIVLEKPGLTLTQPASFAMNMRGEVGKDQMLQVRNGEISLQAGPELQLQSVMEAAIDTTGQARMSTLQLTVTNPVDLQRLLALVNTETDSPTEPATPPPPGPEETGIPKLPTDLWLITTLQAKELRYGALIATDSVVRIELKEGKLTIDDTGLKLNGSPMAIGAMLNTQPDAPPFTFDFAATDMPLDPFIQTFAGNLPVRITGGLKAMNLGLNGEGLTPAALRDALAGDAVLELSSLQVEQAEGLFGTLLDALVLKQFDLTMQDLKFNAGGGKAQVQNGTISTPGMSILGQDMRFTWDGTVSFREGWVPNLTIVPAFQGALAQRLLDKKLTLTQGEDGYWVAPPLKIQSASLSTTEIAAMGLNYGIALGRIDKKYGAAAQGLGVLGDLLKKPDATAQPQSEAQRQQKSQDTIKSVLDLLEKKEEPKTEEPTTGEPAGTTEDAAAPQETPKEPEKKKSGSDALQDALRGILPR